MLRDICEHFKPTGSSSDNGESATVSAAVGSTQSLHDGRWFELVDPRDHIEDGCIARSPVTIRVVFTITN